MTDAFHHRPKVVLAQVVALLVVCTALLLGPAPGAKASTSPYCGGTLAAWRLCVGAKRNLYAVSGSGEQHSVCVWAGITSGGDIAGGYGCSGGPGQGVYGAMGYTSELWPDISNNAASSNSVQGTAYQP